MPSSWLKNMETGTGAFDPNVEQDGMGGWRPKAGYMMGPDGVAVEDTGSGNIWGGPNDPRNTGVATPGAINTGQQSTGNQQPPYRPGAWNDPRFLEMQDQLSHRPDAATMAARLAATSARQPVNRNQYRIRPAGYGFTGTRGQYTAPATSGDGGGDGVTQNQGATLNTGDGYGGATHAGNGGKKADHGLAVGNGVTLNTGDGGASQTGVGGVNLSQSQIDSLMGLYQQSGLSNGKGGGTQGSNAYADDYSATGQNTGSNAYVQPAYGKGGTTQENNQQQNTGTTNQGYGGKGGQSQQGSSNGNSGKGGW